MSSFVDEFPLDFTNQGLRELLTLLTRAYWQRDKVVTFVIDTGLSPGALNLDQSTDMIWRDLLRLARAQNQLRALLSTVRTADPAIAPRLDELIDGEPVVEAPGPAAGAAPEDWKNFDPTGAEEQQIVAGFPTLLGIAFLDQGLRKARSVCRFYTVLAGKPNYGTGFRIGPDLLLTNHHVLHAWKSGDQPASHVEAWFNYELDWERRHRTHVPIRCDVATIVGEREHDWAVIRTAEPIPDDFPALEPAVPSAVPAVNDRVYIIQHPNGEPKMIGMDHNLVRHVDADKIQYWTDTEPGSSGSPVFDDDWQLVGLHHRYVTIPRENATDEYRNQGRRIDKVMERMAALGVG